MELWNAEGPFDQLFALARKGIVWVDGTSQEKIPFPLTRYIVRNYDRARESASKPESGQKEIIHINISEREDVSVVALFTTECSTHFSPLWRSPAATGRRMSCRLHTTAPKPLAAIPFPPRMLADLIASCVLHVVFSWLICGLYLSRYMRKVLSQTKYAFP